MIRYSRIEMEDWSIDMKLRLGIGGLGVLFLRLETFKQEGQEDRKAAGRKKEGRKKQVKKTIGQFHIGK